MKYGSTGTRTNTAFLVIEAVSFSQSVQRLSKSSKHRVRNPAESGPPASSPSSNPTVFTMTKDKVFRLPPLPRFRIRHPNKAQQAPCLTVMSALLGCWASNGQGTEGCAKLEEALKTCMDSQVRLIASLLFIWLGMGGIVSVGRDG